MTLYLGLPNSNGKENNWKAPNVNKDLMPYCVHKTGDDNDKVKGLDGTYKKQRKWQQIIGVP